MVVIPLGSAAIDGGTPMCIIPLQRWIIRGADEFCSVINSLSSFVETVIFSPSTHACQDPGHCDVGVLCTMIVVFSVPHRLGVGALSIDP